MYRWNVAAAQYGSRPGQLEANISHHLKFIECAAREQVDLLIFPELSLTGYDAARDESLALSFDAAELAPIQQAAETYKMTIVVGLPIRHSSGISPGAIGFLPDGTRIACHKPPADSDLDSGALSTPLFGQSGRSFALGLNEAAHDDTLARAAAYSGANLYASGRLVSGMTWQSDVMHLQDWAYRYNLPILMANHAWSCDAHPTAGRSACWDDRGRLVIRAEDGELLVIGRRSERGWQGEVIPLR
ncbi:carbon-nitrogen hydrolase family protein [Entomohabitans teleogrylli]|uniref:carbon-nitrogen hydrolase family protein n=1 Tax=Entomohabitans teleogrylli TaxID=1384589 RepID=UPI00073D5FFB|nr:carbon-nitrogen hydrolase family protein [Entomohabitans teleogrylli]